MVTKKLEDANVANAALESEKMQLLAALGITEIPEGKSLSEVLAERTAAIEIEKAAELEKTAEHEAAIEAAIEAGEDVPDTAKDLAEPSLMHRIASWVSIKDGYEVDPGTIYIVGEDETRVSYRFKGSHAENMMGILKNEDGSLITPTPHEHEMHWPVIQGVRIRTGNKICRCGLEENSE